MSGGIGTARIAPPATATTDARLLSASRHLTGATGWLTLETLPESVQAARRFTNSVLGAWDVGDSDADSIVLVVSELVTNAIRAVQKADEADAKLGAEVLLRLRNDGGIRFRPRPRRSARLSATYSPTGSSGGMRRRSTPAGPAGPRYQIHAQSSPELAAWFPPRGQPPRRQHSWSGPAGTSG